MPAHVVQSYVGSYGAMIHPVGACATAAVSVEEGVDKIRLGKAELVVAGGFDDLTLEAIIGFGDMAATADTEMMRAKGISDSKFSRANDRRRLGLRRGAGRRHDPAGPRRPGAARWVCRCWPWSATRSRSPTACTPRSRLRGSARWAPAAAARTRSWRARWPSWASAPTTSRWSPSTTPRRWPTTPTRPSCTSGSPTRWAARDGAPLFVVSQKSLTGHAKGGAAVFQMMGLCQILRDGVIPPNRSLDCVDDELASSEHFVWVRETLRLGEKFPLKAGLVTSLGLRSRVGPDRAGAPAGVHRRARSRAAARPTSERASARVLAGQRRLASAIAGGAPLYERPADRRFDHEAPEKRAGGGDAARSGVAARRGRHLRPMSVALRFASWR